MRLGVHLSEWRKRYGKYLLFGASVLLITLLAVQVWALSSNTKPGKLAMDAITTILEPLPTPAATPATTPAPAAEAPKTSTKVPAKSNSTAKPAAPTSDIAPASACPGQDQLSQYQAVLLCMTNYARSYHKLGSVSIHAALTAAAAAKANDIVVCDEFSHNACGRPTNYWIINKGYTGNCSAENIAEGQKTPGSVFVAWMNSSGHRANILRSTYIHLGVAEQANNQGKPTWVMELGGC